jgi:hypothetical protein
MQGETVINIVLLKLIEAIYMKVFGEGLCLESSVVVV